MGHFKNLWPVQRAIAHPYAAANPVRADQELIPVENFIRLMSNYQAQSEQREFVDESRKAKHDRQELERITVRQQRVPEGSHVPPNRCKTRPGPRSAESAQAGCHCDGSLNVPGQTGSRMHGGAFPRRGEWRFPENGDGEPTYPPRTDADCERIATIIEELGLQILVRSEIYAEEVPIRGEDAFTDVRSAKHDRRIADLDTSLTNAALANPETRNIWRFSTTPTWPSRRPPGKLSFRVLGRQPPVGYFRLMSGNQPKMIWRLYPSTWHQGSTIAICSFNNQFLGTSGKRNNAAVASNPRSFDIMVVHELVASPLAGHYTDGTSYYADRAVVLQHRNLIGQLRAPDGAIACIHPVVAKRCP